MTMDRRTFIKAAGATVAAGAVAGSSVALADEAPMTADSFRKNQFVAGSTVHVSGPP